MQNNQFLANVYNFNPTTCLPNWRKAKAGIRTGVANSRILCIGDSTTFSMFSNANSFGGSQTGDLMHNSYPQRLCDYLNAARINATSNSFSGGGYSGNSGVVRSGANIDARLTFGTNWTVDNFIAETLGGGYLKNAPGVGTLSFVPTVNTDTMNVWYVQFPSLATFTLDVNGTGTTTINPSGTSSTQTTSIVGSLGGNTYNIAYSNASGTLNILILALEAYNSAVKSVQVWNCGCPSLKTGDMLGAAPQSAVVFMQTIPAGLNIINLGINDWDNGVAVATYQSNLTTIVAAAKANGGDVILVCPTPSNPNLGASVATQLTFINAIFAVGAATNSVVVNWFDRMQSQALGQPQGWYYDGAHSTSYGYADMGDLIASPLLAA